VAGRLWWYQPGSTEAITGNFVRDRSDYPPTDIANELFFGSTVSAAEVLPVSFGEEGLGTPAVSGLALYISPVSFGEEGLGAPRVAQVISPAGNISEEGFGTPVLVFNINPASFFEEEAGKPAVSVLGSIEILSLVALQFSG
jgi:hypothetical protein